FVHGIGGIGKSRLLDAFAARQRATGVMVVPIDCRDVEPTEHGFLRELEAAVRASGASAAGAAQRLGALAARALLILDEFDALRLLETWFRSSFMPLPPENVDVVLCGREAPHAAWLRAERKRTFHVLEVGTLNGADALELLRALGVGEAQATRVNRLARGYP